jgi:inner membrane protein
MDSITHIALGGLLGEVFLGKQIGKRAIAIGAISQSLPDIDIVASAWLDVPHDLLAHRGFSHSFLFVALISPVLATSARRWSKSTDIGFKKWVLFFAGQLLIHLLLDSLNAYGTGWLEPFSHERFSFHVIFVADPLYTTWLFIALVALIILRPANKFRTVWSVAGLALSSSYLLYAFANKYSIENETKNILKKQHIAYLRYFTTPTPLNTWLWLIVAEDKRGYQIGHRSVFDSADSINFHYFNRNDSLLAPFRKNEDLKLLLRFSQRYYTIEQRKDTVVFNDLRFGQRLGWDNPNAKFVFRYYLTSPAENKFVVQRGRFAGWNAATIRRMYQRVRGK